MTTAPAEKRFTPIIILLLVAALVAVIALWATEKAGKQSASDHSGDGVATSNEYFEAG